MRILIVCDTESERCFVRQVKNVTRDLDRDEMVYRCDAPLSGAVTFDEAVALARQTLERECAVEAHRTQTEAIHNV